MFELYDKVSINTSKMVTRTYSTSFSLGIRFLSPRLHNAIYAIYGFVRYADEIVDTFHQYNKEKLLAEFKINTYKAIHEKISMNPILHSFQKTVNQYKIDLEYIETFLKSMEMDLHKNAYDHTGYKNYIVGSAEVVGLMCLKVFVEGNTQMFNLLKNDAMALGSAFQKINFLRDLNDDYKNLGRTYFPGIDLTEFNESTKKTIELDIEKDFAQGYEGIKRLPDCARFGVYIAYVYYYSLFKKIQATPSNKILNERVRIPNNKKFALLFKSFVKHSFNLL